MNKHKLQYVRAFIFLLLMYLSQAATAVTVTENDTAIQPDLFSRYLVDSGAQASLDEIRRRSADFIAVDNRRQLNFGYTHDAYWLRLEIQSQLLQPKLWILEFEYAYLDDVSLYVVRPDNIKEMHAGRYVPVSQWPVPARNAAFPLMLNPGEDIVLYMRVVTQAGMALNTRLLSADQYALDNNQTVIIMALYFGMLIALGSYNFLLFLALRQKTFLLYSAFVFTFGFAASGMNGIGPLMLWPDMALTGFADRIVPAGFSVATALAMMFARSFLQMQTLAPRWHRFLSMAIPLWWFGAALTLFSNVQHALQIMSVMGIMTTVTLLATGIAALRCKVPAAGIFVIAWTLLLIGTALLSVRNAGLIPSNFFTVYGMQLGSAAEMLLLSFALAARFNDLKRQKEKAQQALLDTLMQQEKILEQRVSERTSELEKAKMQLQRQATEDALTGLNNRNGLRQYFSQLKKHTPQDEVIALMLIDLDDFKPINDRYGHGAGDEFLQEISRRLQDIVQENDAIGRMGGDEFVVICRAVSDEQLVHDYASRILSAVSAPFCLSNGETVAVGACIGICMRYLHSETLSTLLRCADEAMYQVKRSGKQGILLDHDQDFPDASAPAQ
ncbi:GGDEF domain-containing protein [Thalassolituus hydrocarboniclasticus]|nr:GGDEF domain-containing protein [Thalassolituus hydrocarboniclasticus]